MTRVWSYGYDRKIYLVWKALKSMTKKVKVKGIEFELEDKDAAMILALQELSFAIRRTR